MIAHAEKNPVPLNAVDFSGGRVDVWLSGIAAHVILVLFGEVHQVG